MYICLCKAVTDHDIEAAVVAGARTMGEVQRSLAVSTGCGTCASAAQIVIDQTLAKTLAKTVANALAETGAETGVNTVHPSSDASTSGLRLQDMTKSDITALVYAA